MTDIPDAAVEASPHRPTHAELIAIPDAAVHAVMGHRVGKDWREALSEEDAGIWLGDVRYELALALPHLPRKGPELVWRDFALYAGSILAGWVDSSLRKDGGEYWEAHLSDGFDASSDYPDEQSARTALEKMAREALGL